MPLIVNGVCRYNINGDMSGRPWSNVLDVRIDTTGSIEDREDAVADQAGIILNAWCDQILPQQSTSSTFQSVSWVDLDEADGSVGSITSAQDEVLPQVGSVSGEPFPGMASALVNKSVPRRRGFRQGRLYLGGLGESQASAGSLTTAARNAIQAGFAAFYTAVNQSGSGVLGYSSNICVVHITSRDAEGNPLTGVSDDVTAFATQFRMATQRRRQRK